MRALGRLPGRPRPPVQGTIVWQAASRPRHRGRHRRLALGLILAGLTLLRQASPPAFGADLILTDTLDQEVRVEVLPAQGDLLVLWPQDLERDRPGLTRTLDRLRDAGIEVWLTNPLEAAFLPRSNEHLRTLPGASVTALIEAALASSPKRVLLLGHDRMALPLLRGLRQWQAGQPRQPESSRLAGAVLLYPNLFGPAPAAGDEPELDPVVHATRYPLLVLQPELGALRHRMAAVLEALWQAGAPVFVRLVQGVRDWYPLASPADPSGEDRAQAAAAALLPAQIKAAARLLAASIPAAPPTQVAGGLASEPETALAPPDAQGGKVRGLVERPPTVAPRLRLRDVAGRPTTLADLRGGVVLVNFWATWCPPCVDEIPSMNRLAARYAPADFRILSVNFREGADRVLAFLRQVNVDFPVLLDDDGRASGDWRVFAFPSSFLVDRSGLVRYSVNSAIPWDEPEVFAVIDALVAQGGRGDVPPAGPASVTGAGSVPYRPDTP